MPYLKILAIVILIVVVAGGSLIGLGNWLGPWWAMGGFLAYMVAGIGYYKYNEKKTRCPRQNT